MDVPSFIGVRDAIRLVQAEARALPPERVALEHALGRTLAADLSARADHPNVDNSALDGFACRRSDTLDATPEAPVSLTLVGEVPAGRPFAGRVEAGEAVAIYTGGAVPAGADAIVPVEHADSDRTTVRVRRPGEPGDIRPRGQDLQAGRVYLRRGRRLDALALALAGALGHAEVPVAQRPRVLLLVTGDEVVAPGGSLAPGQVFNANAPGLHALLQAAGAEVIAAAPGADAPEALARTVDGALASASAPITLVLSSGGVSMGARDAVRDLLLARAEVRFWKVAMKPGGPALLANYRGVPWLALPGNPVSSLVVFVLLALPFLAAAQNASAPLPYRRRRQVLAGAPMRASGAKETFWRVQLRWREGREEALPTRSQSSGVLSALAEADALALLPPHAEVAAGDRLEVIPLAPFLG